MEPTLHLPVYRMKDMVATNELLKGSLVSDRKAFHPT